MGTLESSRVVFVGQRNWLRKVVRATTRGTLYDCLILSIKRRPSTGVATGCDAGKMSRRTRKNCIAFPDLWSPVRSNSLNTAEPETVVRVARFGLICSVA